jgi:hypothetical protein
LTPGNLFDRLSQLTQHFTLDIAGMNGWKPTKEWIVAHVTEVVLGGVGTAARGWQCPVCLQFFSDPKRALKEEPTKDLGSHGWMAL